MFNLPVKLSVMSAPFCPLSPQVYLDCTPEFALRVFLDILPEQARQTVEFAFSPRALLLILEYELEVQVARRQLVFIKPALDAESWLLANGITRLPDLPPSVESELDLATEALWHLTALFTAGDEPVESRIALKKELKTLLVLYWQKYGQHKHSPPVPALKTVPGMLYFLNLVVAEAIYKADATRILFGRESQYHQLWYGKQIQFYRYIRLLQRHPHLKVPA